MRKIHVGCLVLLLGCCATSGVARAGEFAWGAAYVGEYTSNATRAPTNEVEDWIHAGMLGFGYRELTSSVQAFVQATAEYRHYAHETYSDYVTGIADAVGVWHIAPRQFVWLAEDTYRQLLENPTASATPDNLTNVNVFSTGPDLLLRFTPVSAFQIGGRGGSVMDSDGNTDNVNYSYYGRLLHAVSPLTVLSLNFEQLGVDMEDDIASTDYTRYDAFLGISRRAPTSVFGLELGRTQISRDRGEDLVGNRARLYLTRQATTETSYGLSARSGYGDTGSDLLAASRTYTGAPTSADLLLVGRTPAPTPLAAPTSGGLTGTVSGDIYFDQRADVFLRTTGARWSAGLLGFWQKLDYETTPDDRSEYGGAFELTYLAGDSLLSGLFGDQRNIEYFDITRDDSERNIGMRFRYLYSREISLGLEARQVVHHSSISTFEFRETRVSLGIVYSTSAFYSPLLRR